MPALDEDPAGPRDPRPGAVDRDRAGRRAGGLRGRGPADRRAEDHRLALQQEARPEREGPPPAAPVLQRQRVEVAVDRDDLAAPVGGDLLDHRPELGGGLDGTPALRRAPVGRRARRSRSGRPCPRRYGWAPTPPGSTRRTQSVLELPRRPDRSSDLPVLQQLARSSHWSAVLPSSSSSPGSRSPAVSASSRPSASGLSSPGCRSSGRLPRRRCRSRDGPARRGSADHARHVVTASSTPGRRSDQGEPLLAAGEVLVAAAYGVARAPRAGRATRRRPAPRRRGRRGWPGRGSSRATIPIALRWVLDEVAVDRRAVAGHDDRAGGEQPEHDVEGERPLHREAVGAEAGHARGAAATPRPGRRRAARRRRAPGPPGRRRCGRVRGAPARPAGRRDRARRRRRTSCRPARSRSPAPRRGAGPRRCPGRRTAP